MPFILQHDLLIYKQARKFICNTHKLQPGVGITGSESLCLLFCYHSDLSLQAEVFLTLRYPQFLFLPDSHLYNVGFCSEESCELFLGHAVVF